MDRAVFAHLMSGRLGTECQNMLLCVPTGVGKTFLRKNVKPK
jgi:replicative superfamily II helicase